MAEVKSQFKQSRKVKKYADLTKAQIKVCRALLYTLYDFEELLQDFSELHHRPRQTNEVWKFNVKGFKVAF